MKLETVLNPLFKSALSKLMTGDIPIKATFKLEGIVDAVNSELSKYEKVRVILLKKYVKLKEDGSFDSTDDGAVVFKSEEDAQTFVKELSDLNTSEVDIPRLKLSDLGDLDGTGVRLTVDELRKLKESILEV